MRNDVNFDKPWLDQQQAHRSARLREGVLGWTITVLLAAAGLAVILVFLWGTTGLDFSENPWFMNVAAVLMIAGSCLAPAWIFRSYPGYHYEHVWAWERQGK